MWLRALATGRTATSSAAHGRWLDLGPAVGPGALVEDPCVHRRNLPAEIRGRFLQGSPPSGPPTSGRRRFRVPAMDDAALVEAARSGDDTAWAAIYDRYADKLHDHCHRILRDRDEAADALHDAFLAASRNLHQLRDPSRLRPWLYSICRHISLRRLKARGRVELTDAPDEMSAPDDGLDRGVRAEELSELVWAAAAGLSGRDQALLDLNLRQGLEGQDLADAMGTTPEQLLRDAQPHAGPGGALARRPPDRPAGPGGLPRARQAAQGLGRQVLAAPAQAGGPPRRRLRDLLRAAQGGRQPAGPARRRPARAGPGAPEDPGHLEHPQRRRGRRPARALHEGGLRRPRRRRPRATPCGRPGSVWRRR